MARFVSKKKIVGLVAAALLAASPSARAADPHCIEHLRKERVRLLEEFGKLQNYKTFTEAKARKLQNEVEQYLIAIGDLLKNFNLDIFFDEQLSKLPRVADLSASRQAALADVLRPAFESRRMPSYRNLAGDLRKARFNEVPVREVRDLMDKSFKIWRTKLIFEEGGTTVWNQLAKAFVEKQDIGEFSMSVGLLGKNEWEAFFESEKGKGIFNGDVPGMLKDMLTDTSVHEAVHMVVETLASKGHESPYAFWMKVDHAYKKTGAVGPRQKKALAEAVDPLSDGDYYRNELYLDEIPAHGIQSSFKNVELSRALQDRFDEVLKGARANETKNDLKYAYADYLRDGKVDWTEYSDLSRRKFEEFLASPAKDERTHLSKILSEMAEYANWIDLLNDSGMSAAYEARKIIDEEVALAKKNGIAGLPASERIAIKPDVFLGQPGYRIEVRIPVEVMDKDKNFHLSKGAGATVNFRFTNMGKAGKSITPEQLRKLVDQTDWIAEMTERNRKALEDYAEFLDSNGALVDYTIEGAFKMKRVHTRLRQIARDTARRIRAS